MRDDIVAIFKTPRQGSLFYFFCHGTADKLEFDKSKKPLTPNSLTKDLYPGWPIIFLNACEVGDVSPLSFFTFRKRFPAKRAAGVVAPSFTIPTLFAAVFGKSVLEGYTSGKRIGEVLFGLRQRLIADGNPLGLWYSLQCPLDVRAPR